MKTTIVALVLVAVASTLFAEQNKKLRTLQQALEKQQTVVLDQYDKGLDTIMVGLKKNGDLDNFLVLQVEKKRFAQEKTVPIPQDAGVSFRAATTMYYQSMATWMERYVKELDYLIKEEMTADRIEEAKNAGAEKDKARLILADFQAKLPAKVTGITPTETSRSKSSEAGRTVTCSLDSVEVEALIDGNSELHVTTNGLYWVNINAAKPGRHGGQNEPTLVNGKAWMPTWGNPQKEGGSDTTDIYPIKMKSLNLSIQLLAVSNKQGGTGILKRDAIRTSMTPSEYVVFIPDSQGGSRWYRFKLKTK